MSLDPEIRGPNSKMEHRAIISSWLIRLITWDGVLPVTVWLVPFLIRSVIPNNRAAIEYTALFLPIVAFVVRFQVGRRYISSNDCGAVLRCFQVTVFCFGIILLVLIDFFVMLSHVMPKEVASSMEALIVWAVSYGIYLAAMAFAMYPGSSRSVRLRA